MVAGEGSNQEEMTWRLDAAAWDEFIQLRPRQVAADQSGDRSPHSKEFVALKVVWYAVSKFLRRIEPGYSSH